MVHRNRGTEERCVNTTLYHALFMNSICAFSLVYYVIPGGGAAQYSIVTHGIRSAKGQAMHHVNCINKCIAGLQLALGLSVYCLSKMISLANLQQEIGAPALEHISHLPFTYIGTIYSIYTY